MTQMSNSADAALKSYLVQIDETLKTVLESISSNVTAVSSVLAQNGEAAKEVNDNVYAVAVRLKSEQLERFDELKSDIIRTADEVTDECRAYTDTREDAVISAVEADYVAQSDFGTYTSATDATLALHEGEISANAERSETIDSDLQQFKRDAEADFTLTPEAITSMVSDSFISSDELNGESLESFIGSKVTQTASGITDEFYSQLSAVSDEIGSVNDGINGYIDETSAYIRRGELETDVYGIEIGRSDSNIKTRFLNDRISFYQGSVEVAYISDNNLYILRAEILDYLKIGNSTDGYFTFDVSSNGLEVRWSS